MNYYNSNLGQEGFNPQTFEATPWGWYPIPVPEGGKIADVVMPIPVADLNDTLEDMNFVMTLAQQASAATTFQQGVANEGTQVTLGEVQLLLKNAQERVKSMAVYYVQSWKDFGLKYAKMMEAAPDKLDAMTIYKKGKTSSKMYAKKILPEMLFSKNGWHVEVKMREEVESQYADSLQKLQFSKSLMPGNMSLDTIIKKKSLDFAGLNASEMSEVLKEDEMISKQMAANPMAQMGMSGQQGQPMQQGGLPQIQPPQQLPAGA
jgi:hypothetical protein